MKTELVKNNGSAVPAKLSDEAANLLKQTARANPLLRYKKGKYCIGDDEVALGREYIAFCTEWTIGWCRWQDGQIVEERLGKPAEGYSPPDRDELGHTDKSAWEDGDSDPWARQSLLPLEDCESGEFIVFVTSSFGGKLAIEKLVNRYAREIGTGRNLGNPIIKLGSYERTNKEYGPIPTPMFEVVGWENENAPLPPLKEALNDDIPYK
jgi:hypothetical protein